MTEPPVFDICGPLPSGTTVLEASAGTGKTWTIAALVTRFVAEGHADLSQMLVVTFGRAASQELRERVRDQLVEAERELDRAIESGTPAGSAGSESTLIELLLDAPPTELHARRTRLRDALTDFDAATIATTHQFCQLVLRGLGVAGDTDPGARLVEDLDDLLTEVVDDLYVADYARSEEPPPFDRRTALAVARAAAYDPQARLEPRNAPADSVAGRRLAFAEAVRAELDVRKRRLGILSYDDLLSRLADTLADPDAPARRRMRDRWQVVLVDEFQDTDPVQWQVLDRAFNGHATMVLIGDPKQAIYAFRGGDVVTYLEAEATATAKATLGTNHRSDAALLRSLQAVLLGAALGDDRILVRDVRAAHDDGRLVGAPASGPFRLRLVDRERFGVAGAKGVAIGDLRAFVAADLAADVRALLASDATFCGSPLVARDIAVLCETRRQCEVVRGGLTSAGIPAVIAGSGSVYSTPAADDWLCLLEALEQPHRSGRVRAAALTCFFGMTADDIDTGGDALTAEVADVVRDWADLLRRRGVAAVFETALRTRAVASRVLSGEGGERLMTDLRHLAESLHDAATRDQLGVVALLVWLRERMEQARLDVTGERTRRLDSDAAAVQILTIHGSKGLEYPVVYLPFVSDLFPRQPDPPLFHDDEGTRCLDVGGKGSDPESVRRATVEEAGEDLRLLYVAMTRAQSQLVTWWLPSGKNLATSPLHRMLFGRRPGQRDVMASAPVHDDARTREIAHEWETAGGPAVERVAEQPAERPVSARPEGPLGARRWTRSVDQAWRRTSYTALSSASMPPTEAAVASFGSEPEVVPRADEPDTPTPTGLPAAQGVPSPVPSPMADLPVGATFGSLVHAVLEHADPAAPGHGGDLRAELLSHVRDQLVRWPVRVEPEALADALVEVCRTPLGPLVDGRTLEQIGTRDRMAELDFELPLGGGDVVDAVHRRRRLADLAPLLHRHLPADDPLRPYAETLSDPAATDQLLAGYLTGSVDVVLRTGGRFVVVDYKTNWLGGPEERLTSDHYRPERLAEAMTHSTYPLQALLYAVVLHRFLRWRLSGYDPARHFGGVMYLYLRGMCGASTPVIGRSPCGVFSWQPPPALVADVSDLLDGAVRDRAVRGAGR